MAKRSELMVVGTPVVLKAYAPMGIPEQKGTVETPWDPETETVVIRLEDGELTETTCGCVIVVST